MNRGASRKHVLALVSAIPLIAAAGDSGIQGTYTDTGDSLILELKPGAKAEFTFMGDVKACRYGVSGRTLTVDCNGAAGTTVFNIHDDGTLTGPPDSLIPPLWKK